MYRAMKVPFQRKKMNQKCFLCDNTGAKIIERPNGYDGNHVICPECTHYRISRNAAVLLGKDKEDSKTIFSEIKDLYDKRSKIVHTGNSNIINEEDLLKLRHYVRESIKEIIKVDKNKDELLELLNSCGFGEKSWTE